MKRISEKDDRMLKSRAGLKAMRKHHEGRQRKNHLWGDLQVRISSAQVRPIDVFEHLFACNKAARRLFYLWTKPRRNRPPFILELRNERRMSINSSRQFDDCARSGKVGR